MKLKLMLIMFVTSLSTLSFASNKCVDRQERASVLLDIMEKYNVDSNMQKMMLTNLVNILKMGAFVIVL